MRYGLEVPAAGPCGDDAALAELARIAEKSGWDGIFLEDYICYQGDTHIPTYDPWVALAAMALRTSRIRLGTSVTPLARRRPWKLAREAVTLDHLSRGRLILGAGLGMGDEASFAAFGEQANGHQRAEMLDEALAILAGLWSGQPFSFSGQHYTVAEVTFLPMPLQAPHIPIWVGGGWPKRGPLQRAARWDGFLPYRHADDWTWRDLTPADLHAMRAAIATQRPSQAPFDYAIGGRSRREDEAAERAHIRAMAEAGATWWMESMPPTDPATMRAAIARGPLRVE